MREHDHPHRTRKLQRVAAITCVLAGTTACGDGATPADRSAASEAPPAAGAAASTPTGLLDVKARGMAFDAPDRIPSGWTTVRFTNEPGVTHFVILEKLPPGRTLADSKAEVVPVFQQGMDLLIEGKADAAAAKFGELPAWYSDIVFMGGPGITAPGRTSEVVVHLDPGTYILECYIKTPDGKFHSALGMIDEVTVTDETSGAAEPTPTLELTLRNDGIVFADGAPPGRHTVAVRFADQQVHGNFLGNDVHLVRLEGDTNLDALAAWMNWSLPAGLVTPAPAGFLGGLHEMPAGTTGYLEVVLEPGRYAWIAEVDDPAAKNMLKTFTVPSGGTMRP